MQKIPPIAPIFAKGPLGLVHLPRMWSKALLHGAGELAPGYQVGCYFDRTVMGSLGIDVSKALAFLQAERPTYLAFEAWVAREAGERLDTNTIAEINDHILSHELGEEDRRAFQQELGLSDESAVRTTAELEMLDAWVQFHTLLTGKERSDAAS